MDDSDGDVGLAFEPNSDWEPDVVRSAADALAPLSLDLGDRVAAEERPKVDLGGLGDRLTSDDGGLRTSADGDLLRDDLAKLKEHEADLKLRALLDKAERAIRARQVEDAWAHVEAALEIALTSVPALLLGARCQHMFGEFETALELLATARQHARDAAEVTLVLRLREVSARALTDETGLHARGFLDQDNASAAIEFVEQRMARHPEIVGLHYIHGAVLLRTGHLTRAREVIEAVLATDQATGIEAFTELHRAILSELCAPDVESARQSLRAGRPKAAIDQLVACGDALRTNPRYERLWSYAHERYAKSSKVSFVSRRRARQADATPLDANALQEVLTWVLTEEIKAGLAAFSGADFDGASQHCARAEAIDSRCGTVAYLHAVVEASAADMVLRKVDLSTLATAQRHLDIAAESAAKIAVDPVLTERGNQLITRIEADRREVVRLTRYVSCVSRFNTLMSRYENRRIRTREELHQVRGELRSIKAAANASKKEHRPGSPARQTLDDLTGAIETLLR